MSHKSNTWYKLQDKLYNEHEGFQTNAFVHDELRALRRILLPTLLYTSSHPCAAQRRSPQFLFVSGQPQPPTLPVMNYAYFFSSLPVVAKEVVGIVASFKHQPDKHQPDKYRGNW